MWLIGSKDKAAPEAVCEQWMRNTLESILKRSADFSCFLNSLLWHKLLISTLMQQCCRINCHYTHTHSHRMRAPTQVVTVWHTGWNFAPLRFFISWKLLCYLKEMPSLLPNAFIFLESEHCDLWLTNSEIPNRGEKKKADCDCPLRLCFCFVFLPNAQNNHSNNSNNNKKRSQEPKGEHKSTHCLNWGGHKYKHR